MFHPDPASKQICPKHVEFYSKNKFEKLVHLVGFIIRIYHDAQSSECQIKSELLDQLSASYPVRTRGAFLVGKAVGT